MRWIADLVFRIRSLLTTGRTNRELDEEVAFHLDMEVQEHLERGLSEDEARRLAQRSFGGVARQKERVREAWGVGTVHARVADTRFALRLLRRNPAFTIAAVITLALGIGATTTMFSVVNAVLLRPLPFDEPERILRLYSVFNGQQVSGVAYPDFTDWKKRSDLFGRLSVAHGWGVTLIGDGGSHRLTGVSVNAEYFDVLGVRPLHGRFFLPDEDVPGHDPVVVLSHDLWQRQFGGDPDIVGRSIVLSDLRDEQSYVVIGIAPADYETPLSATTDIELWRSTQDYWSSWNRGNHPLRAVGRLQQNVTLDRAQREMDVLATQLAAEYPETNDTKTFRLVQVRDVLIGDVRPMVLVLFAAVALVLLIAAANVANLLLARATARAQEIAVRLSLGASRRRLVTQLLTESLVLGCAGALLGLALTSAGVPSLLRLSMDSVPRLDALAVDRTVLLFALLVTMISAVTFGLAPALIATRGQLAETLREGGRGTAGTRDSLLRRGIVVGQIAIALVLLTGAGLLIRSYANLLAVPTGVQTENVLSIRLRPAAARQPDKQLADYYGQVSERLEALPGVLSIGASSQVPVRGGSLCTGIVHGVRESPIRDWLEPCVEYTAVSEGFPKTMGLEVVAGRMFTRADHELGVEVSSAIVNETASRRYFPDGDAVGRYVTTGIGTSHEIVGVYRDFALHGRAEPLTPALYLPQESAPGWVYRNQYFFILTRLDPISLLPAVRNEVWGIDDTAPITTVRTMDEVLAEDAARPRFRTLLLIIFALLATLLAAVGIAGLMAYTVAQRRPELAVRLALGARAADVVGLVVSRAFRLAAIGIGLGVVGALLLTRFLSSLLFGVDSADPMTLGVVALLLGLVVVGATVVPARRAAAVDPMRVLSAE